MEKRNFKRVQFHECASIKHDNQTFFARIENVCLQGLFIHTDQELPLHAPLQITIYISPRSSIYLNVDVVHREDNGMGVRIKGMDVNSFALLRDVISAQCNDYELVMMETYKVANCIKLSESHVRTKL